jgi:hypothetical protein
MPEKRARIYQVEEVQQDVDGLKAVDEVVIELLEKLEG